MFLPPLQCSQMVGEPPELLPPLRAGARPGHGALISMPPISRIGFGAGDGFGVQAAKSLLPATVYPGIECDKTNSALGSRWMRLIAPARNREQVSGRVPTDKPSNVSRMLDEFTAAFSRPAQVSRGPDRPTPPAIGANTDLWHLNSLAHRATRPAFRSLPGQRFS